MVAPKTKTSQVVKYRIPEYLASSKPKLVEFLQYYYKWMEGTDQPLDVLQNLLDYKDIDSATNFFSDMIMKQLLKVVPKNAVIDRKLLAKHVREYFRARGSIPSYNFVMNALFDVQSEVEYQSKYVSRCSYADFTREAEVSIESTEDLTKIIGSRLIQTTPNSAYAYVTLASSTTVNGKQIWKLNLTEKSIIGTFTPYGEIKALKNTVDRSFVEVTEYYDFISLVGNLLTVRTYGSSIKDYSNLIVYQMNNLASCRIVSQHTSYSDGHFNYLVFNVDTLQNSPALRTESYDTLKTEQNGYIGVEPIFNGTEQLYIIAQSLVGKIYTKADYCYGIVNPTIGDIDVTRLGSLNTPKQPIKFMTGSGIGVEAYIDEVNVGGVDQVLVMTAGQDYSVGDKVVAVEDKTNSGVGFDAEVSHIDGYGASALAILELDNIIIEDGGAGYKVNDVIEINGGVFDPSVGPIKATVSAVQSAYSTYQLSTVKINNPGENYRYANIALVDNSGVPVAGFNATAEFSGTAEITTTIPPLMGYGFIASSNGYSSGSSKVAGRGNLVDNHSPSVGFAYGQCTAVAVGAAMNWNTDLNVTAPGTGTGMEYSTPGNYSFTVPAGVESVTLTLVGAGGGGAQGSHLNQNTGGSGGGGGEYIVNQTIAVTPGQIIPVTVGQGGIGGPGWNPYAPINGTNGGNSSFGNLVMHGGTGGQIFNGAVGIGGTGTGTAGGNGTQGITTIPYRTAVGGSGGRSIDGTIVQGTCGRGVSGFKGQGGAGGGSGVCNGSGEEISQPGGNGGNGYAKLAWAQPDITTNWVNGVLKPTPPGQEYSTPGTYNFVVPSGITSIVYEGVGAGGGGSGGSDGGFVRNGPGGYGGASGTYGTNTIAVTPGETLTIIIGTGGVGSIKPSCCEGGAGTAGTSTQIKRGATVLATLAGGAGGTANNHCNDGWTSANHAAEFGGNSSYAKGGVPGAVNTSGGNGVKGSGGGGGGVIQRRWFFALCPAANGGKGGDGYLKLNWVAPPLLEIPPTAQKQVIDYNTTKFEFTDSQGQIRSVLVKKNSNNTSSVEVRTFANLEASLTDAVLKKQGMLPLSSPPNRPASAVLPLPKQEPPLTPIDNLLTQDDRGIIINQVVNETPLSPTKNPDQIKVIGNVPAGGIKAITVNTVPALSSTNYTLKVNGYGATAHATIGGAGALVTTVVDTQGYNYVDPVIEVVGDGYGAILVPVLTSGRVTSITIKHPGTGYSTVTLVVKERYGSGADIVPIIDDSTVAGTGAITGLTITQRGLYNILPDTFEVPVTGGTGINAKVSMGFRVANVDLVDHGQMYHQVSMNTYGGQGRDAVLQPTIIGGVVTHVSVLNGGVDYARNSTITWNTTNVGAIPPVLTPIVKNGKIQSIYIADGGTDCSYNDTFSIVSGVAAVFNTTSTGIGEIISAQQIDGGHGYIDSSELQPTKINVSGIGHGAIIQPVIENGKIINAHVLSSGWGYDGTTSLTVVGGGGSSAVVTPVIDIKGSITRVKVTNSGFNYRYGTSAYVLGDGYGATLTPIVDTSISDIKIIETGLGYDPLTTTVSIWDKTGTGAIVKPVFDAQGKILDIQIINAGSGYTDPKVIINSTWHSHFYPTCQAKAVVTRSIKSITVTSPGQQYMNARIVIVGDGSGAKFEPKMQSNGAITTVGITSKGSNYVTTPVIQFSDPSGYGAITKVKVNNKGEGFNAFPLLTVESIHGTNAKLISLSSDIGAVKSITYKSVGADYNETPIPLFPLNVIVDQNASFTPNEKVQIKNFSYAVDDGLYGLLTENGDVIVAESLDYIKYNQPFIYEDGPVGYVDYMDYSRNILSIIHSTDRVNIISEDDMNIVLEDGLNLVHQISNEITSGHTIVGVDSGAYTNIIYVNRSGGVCNQTGNTFNSPKFNDDSGKLNNKNIKLHNGERIQDFAYVVKSGMNFKDYEEFLKKTVHPAGTKMFGDIIIWDQIVGPKPKYPWVLIQQEAAGEIPMTVLSISLDTGWDEFYIHDYRTFLEYWKNKYNGTPMEVFGQYSLNDLNGTTPIIYRYGYDSYITLS